MDQPSSTTVIKRQFTALFIFFLMLLVVLLKLAFLFLSFPLKPDQGGVHTATPSIASTSVETSVFGTVRSQRKLLSSGDHVIVFVNF